MLNTQTLFRVVAGFGGLYFHNKNRQFGYFTLAYFGALVYFLPGFLGSTSYHIGGVWSDTLIHPEAYWVMIFVLLSIWVATWIMSHVPKALDFKMALPTESGVSMSILLLLSAVVGFAGLLATSGSLVLQPGKEVVMESLGRWHILLYTAATIGLPVALHQRQYVLGTVFLVFLGFDLFLGFRSALTISIISAVVILLSTKGKLRLIFFNWKIVLASLVFGLFMFGYKSIALIAMASVVRMATNSRPEKPTR